MTAPSKTREDRQAMIAQAVFGQVRRLLPEGPDCEITLDTSLDEIGLDSLATMDVLGRLEEAFGMRFSEESLYDMETCRDVVEYIEARAEDGTLASGRRLRWTARRRRPRLRRTKTSPAAEYDVTQFPECVALRAAIGGHGGGRAWRTRSSASRTALAEAMATIAGREVVSYTSFDYLGLAGQPRVIAAAKEAIDRFGTSASASRLVGGNHAIVRQLDEELARFLGTEAAVAFPADTARTPRCSAHLFGPQDLILYDELAHNSIVQGALLSKAAAAAVPAQRLRVPRPPAARHPRRLSPRRGRHRGRLQHGRRLPRPAAVHRGQAAAPRPAVRRRGPLARRDGRRRAGASASISASTRPRATCGWARSARPWGAAAATSPARGILIEYLKYTTPAFVFATALSPANAAAALEALRRAPGGAGARGAAARAVRGCFSSWPTTAGWTPARAATRR